MKGEYVEPLNKNEAMFSKLHNHPHPHPFSHHHFQLSPSDETATTHQDKKAKTFSDPSSGGDGEVLRRPRGRPAGSKNKPKPPVFIARVEHAEMSPYILEVPGGSDIVETISRFCRRKGIGLCVLTGSGAVSNVTLRQPSSTPGSTITFHGRFDILSISATFLQQTASYQVPNVFTISLAGPQGQIVGGAVAGPLLAASTVYVVAATFNNPSYHRLPMEEERNSMSGGGGVEGQSPAGSAENVNGVEVTGQAVESGGMPMYNCQVSGGSDVIWAPTPRPLQQQQQPPQPPPPY
jgi:predicted DNA-binding protein with PD1-like motif